jgi:hypothetical protein
VQKLLDRIDAPAYICNGRMDVLATNRLGEALYSEILVNPRRPANTARFCFLDERDADGGRRAMTYLGELLARPYVQALS